MTVSPATAVMFTVWLSNLRRNGSLCMDSPPVIDTALSSKNIKNTDKII